MLERDPGETALEYMREATGLRQTTCPWRALRDPFVVTVLNARRWKRDGELQTRFGGRPIPVALRDGLDVLESALNAVEVTDSRADAAERKAEDERRRAELEAMHR